MLRVNSIVTERNKCIKGVFRQGRSSPYLEHRYSFPEEISIDLVQNSVKLIIIIEVTNCAVVLITCFVFVL